MVGGGVGYQTAHTTQLNTLSTPIWAFMRAHSLTHVPHAVWPNQDKPSIVQMSPLKLHLPEGQELLSVTLGFCVYDTA